VRTATAEIASVTTTFHIDIDHPALPGHFPGAPVVPGVLLLAEGLNRLESLADAPLRCQRIDNAKFLQPVAPGATITVTLTTIDGGRKRVDFHVAGALVAHLTLIAAAPAGQRIHE